MRTPRRTPRASGWVAAAAAVLACGGCGFKGPLYLPERNATVVTHPAPAAQGAQGAAPQGQAQSPTAKQKDKSPPPAPAPPASPPASPSPSPSPPPPI
ncbi:MAG: LPS translocon maturation chaperone LptM [Steroidobacteraceae bacterium]